MTKIVTSLAAAVAGSVVLVALAMPASAIDLGDRNKGLGVTVNVGGADGLGVDVGATVGDRARGVNADARANVGGSKGLADADATASAGGRNGINADAKANVGGRDLARVDATVSVGGNKGINADVDARIGRSIDARAKVDIGGNGIDSRVVIGGVAPGPVDPGPLNPRPNVPKPAVPTPGINPAVPKVIANMSDDEVVRFQRRCRGILSDQAAYDRDLIALCRMLQVASR